MKIDAPIEAQIPALRSLWREAFGDTDEFLDIFEATAFSRSRCRCVTIGGNVAAAILTRCNVQIVLIAMTETFAFAFD